MKLILSLIIPKVLYIGLTSFGTKRTIIRFESHALSRMVERGSRFQLPYETTRTYTIQTVLTGRPADKHLSKRHWTYCHYFKENLTLYVICEECREKKRTIKTIKTVIIERGRP